MRSFPARPPLFAAAVFLLVPLVAPRLAAQGAHASIPGFPAIAEPAAQEAPDLPAPTSAAAASSDSAMLAPLKLREESLDQVLNLLQRLTGRAIIRPQQLPASTYTFTSQKPMTRAETILALETLLSLNQIGITPLGEKFLKATPLGLTRTEAPEMLTGSAYAVPASGRIMSKLYQPEFLRVSEFLPQIQPTLNPNTGGVTIFDKANTVLITDTVSNLQRIDTLIARLDQPTTKGFSPKFYTIHFAKASDLVGKLHTILSGTIQNQLGSATTFNADDRTNQVILISDSRQQSFFDGLIAKLDVKADPNTRNEVIYLKHATAKDVASQAGGARATPSAPAETPAPVPGQPALPGAAAIAAAGITAPTNEFSSLVTILPDDRSNAVVVSGTMDDIRLIRELVDKIDIVLAQVRIEVIIADVTLSDEDISGISALHLNVGPAGSSATTTTDSSGNSTSSLTGNTSGITKITNFSGTVAGWNISSGVVNPLSFAAAMTNVGSNSKVRVLSAPTIITTHNKEAEFISGTQQPIITNSQSTPIGVTTNVSTGFSTSSSVTYKDIALDLKVTPLIGDDGSIQLKIDQKVDEIGGEVLIDGNQQPIINHRQATSFVNVYDGQMIVLGGLQRTNVTKAATKLGLLYEIPILSRLFGGRDNKIERDELLLFIRPHVIRPTETTADAYKTIETLSNKQQIKQFLKNPGSQPTKNENPILERFK